MKLHMESPVIPMSRLVPLLGKTHFWSYQGVVDGRAITIIQNQTGPGAQLFCEAPVGGDAN